MLRTTVFGNIVLVITALSTVVIGIIITRTMVMGRWQ
jgi:hypothetical protein